MRRKLAQLASRLHAAVAAQEAHQCSDGAHAAACLVQCRTYAQQRLPAEYQGLYTGKAAVPKPRPAAQKAPESSVAAAAQPAAAQPAAAQPAQQSRGLTAAEQKASAEAGEAVLQAAVTAP